MNRRDVLATLMTPAMVSSCSRADLSEGELREYCRTNDLAVLTFNVHVFDLARKSWSTIAPPTDYARQVNVSSDSSTLLFTPDIGSEIQDPVDVLLVSIDRKLEPVHVNARFVLLAAASSSAHSILCSILMRNDPIKKVFYINSSSGEQKRLVSFEGAISPREIDRLSLSSDGKVGAVGTRNGFVVLDTSADKVLFVSDGRFPAVSPSGEVVAYVDPQGNLRTYRLKNQTHSTLSMGFAQTAYAVGGWSPDGRFLLVGTGTVLRKYLAILEMQTGHYSRFDVLIEGDWGNRSCWLDRRLVGQRTAG